MWEWLPANSGLDFLWKGCIWVINHKKKSLPLSLLKCRHRIYILWLPKLTEASIEHGLWSILDSYKHVFPHTWMQMNWGNSRAGQDSPLLFIELGKVRTFTFGLIHLIIIKYLFHKWSKTGKIESGIAGNTKHVFLSNTLQWIFHF